MSIQFKRKIAKFGGSHRITIPKEIIEALALKSGDVLRISLEGSTIKMTKD